MITNFKNNAFKLLYNNSRHEFRIKKYKYIKTAHDHAKNKVKLTIAHVQSLMDYHMTSTPTIVNNIHSNALFFIYIYCQLGTSSSLHKVLNLDLITIKKKVMFTFMAFLPLISYSVTYQVIKNYIHANICETHSVVICLLYSPLMEM